MDKSFYTELIYRHKCIEDYGPKEICHKVTAWDTGLDELIDTFKGIMVLAGFSEKGFEDALVEYLEERNYQVTYPQDVKEE